MSIRSACVDEGRTAFRAHRWRVRRRLRRILWRAPERPVREGRVTGRRGKQFRAQFRSIR